METKFQTSFIPKKPLAPIGGPAAPVHHSRGSSIYMTLATLLFIASLAAAGGTYAWKSLVISSQEGYKTQLAEREKQFNVDLIQELKAQNVKIDYGQQLLAGHIASSLVFDIIGRLTAESVRFLSLDLSNTGTDGLKVALRGYGTSFSAVAFQSDVLSSLEQYGLRNIIKNPILSDPALDTSGAVSFGFSASLNPSSLSYEQSVTGAPAGGSSQGAASSTSQ